MSFVNAKLEEFNNYFTYFKVLDRLEQRISEMKPND